jgi:hypothetical protein
MVARTASIPLSSILRSGQCPSNDAILPSIQLPPVFRPTMILECLPSAMVTADRIFRDPRKRPEAPRPEVDLQCINPAGLSCIHERNRAAPAASPTYKSGDTPPRIGFGRSRETAGCSLIRHPASSNGQEALKSRSQPRARSRKLHLTAFLCTGFFPPTPANLMPKPLTA